MVASISSSPGADYYLQVSEIASYYTAESGIGHWYGEASQKFGFEGEISERDFLNAFDGRDANGKSLVQRQEGKDRQEAWDVTFSVPKSVSVLWAMLSPPNRERLEQIVLAASRTSLNYLDENALVTRRGKGGFQAEQAKGTYALIPHATSRAQDPQLHVHALVFNMCLRQDSTTGSIRSLDVYEHKMALGALFRVELGYLLEKKLGIRILQDDWKFEIEGVPKQLCQEFSKRREQIEAIANEEGWSSPKVMAQLALATRDSKEAVTVDKLFPVWQRVAREFGFTRQNAEALLGKSKLLRQDLDDAKPKKLKERILRQSIEKLAKNEAYFPERDIIRHAAVAAQARGLSAREVVEYTKLATKQFEYRVDIKGNDYRHYSTRENVADERELINRALQGTKSDKHLVDEKQVVAAEKNVERSISRKSGLRIEFTDDQRKALRFVTVEPGDVKLVQGYAGTGKTVLLEAAYKAWTKAGYKVIGAAITGKATQGLEEDTGIRSVTVESLLIALNPKLRELSHKERIKVFRSKLWNTIRANWYAEKQISYWRAKPFSSATQALWRIAAEKAVGKKPRFQKPQLNKQTVLVVDEAAMLPTRGMLELKRQCDKAGAKLVLIGDRLQLPPIGAGGPFWSVATRIGHEKLTTIVRQEKEWMREALRSVINNEPEQALEAYAKRGQLEIAPHKKAAIDKLVSDFRTVRRRDLKKTLALTCTNDEAKRINTRIQERRRRAGELGRLSIRLTSGERVYKNDRILFTLNSYRDGVRNGLLGTAIKVEPGLLRKGIITIELDNCKSKGLYGTRRQRVKIDLANYNDLQLGYAVTTHKAQGVTVDRSFVLLGGSMLNKEMAFTQLSRARKETKLYSTELEAGEGLSKLAKHIMISRTKDLAHDHQLQRRKQELQIKQGKEEQQLKHSMTL